MHFYDYDGQANVYGYVNGNPVSYTDPLGLMGQGSGANGGTPTWGKGNPSNNACSSSQSSTPSYLTRVSNNYQQTMGVLPWWTHIPGFNPVTAGTAPIVASGIGGLTWSQAAAYSGTYYAATAYGAAAVTSVANGILIGGAFSTGAWIGSLYMGAVSQ